MKKNYTISVSVRTFWRVLVPVALACIAAGAVAGIIVVDQVIMPRIVGVNRNETTVPDLTGISFEQARQALYDVGLRMNVKSRDYHEEVPRRHVITQSPDPQVRIKKGRLVYVTISKGAEFVTVPSVLGLSERQALIELKQRGIRTGKTRETYSEKVEEGCIVSISPDSGSVISKDSVVMLVVSKGAKPTHTVVPNLAGERLQEAGNLLGKAGLAVGTVTYRNHASLLPGTIISQSLPPGTRILLETPVNIVVARPE